MGAVGGPWSAKAWAGEQSRAANSNISSSALHWRPGCGHPPEANCYYRSRAAVLTPFHNRSLIFGVVPRPPPPARVMSSNQVRSRAMTLGKCMGHMVMHLFTVTAMVVVVVVTFHIDDPLEDDLLRPVDACQEVWVILVECSLHLRKQCVQVKGAYLW